MNSNRYALWATDEITKEFLNIVENTKRKNSEYLYNLNSTGDILAKEYYCIRGEINVLDDIIDIITSIGTGENNGFKAGNKE